MKVSAEPIAGTQIDRLYAAEAVPEFAVAVDDPVGFWCGHCHVLDETKAQVFHEDPDCPHHGEHGRAVYGADPPWSEWRVPPGALRASNAVLVLTATCPCPSGLREGQFVGVTCQCGNSDEDMAEVIHDYPCPLAGEGAAPVTDMPGVDLAADGGRRD